MSAPPLVIGVDGGGTSTDAWLAEPPDRILGRGRAGPSNVQAVGPDRALEALSTAIQAAFEDAGRSLESVEVACFGLAGFDRPQDRALLNRWADAKQWCRALVTVNDGDLVIAAGTPDNAGIALIAGTGSIAVGRTPDGRTARAGGWGYLIGDEGSAYRVALEGLRLVARRADGRAPKPHPDPLTERLRQALGVDQAKAIVSALYQPAWDRTRIAGLAKAVVEAAVEDPQADALVIEPAADQLAETVEAVRRRLDWPLEPPDGPPPLAIAGGFLLGAARLLDRLRDRLQGRVGPITPVPEPARGAVRLALRDLDSKNPEMRL